MPIAPSEKTHKNQGHLDSLSKPSKKTSRKPASLTKRTVLFATSPTTQDLIDAIHNDSSILIEDTNLKRGLSGFEAPPGDLALSLTTLTAYIIDITAVIDHFNFVLTISSSLFLNFFILKKKSDILMANRALPTPGSRPLPSTANRALPNPGGRNLPSVPARPTPPGRPARPTPPGRTAVPTPAARSTAPAASQGNFQEKKKKKRKKRDEKEEVCK